MGPWQEHGIALLESASAATWQRGACYIYIYLLAHQPGILSPGPLAPEQRLASHAGYPVSLGGRFSEYLKLRSVLSCAGYWFAGLACQPQALADR